MSNPQNDTSNFDPKVIGLVVLVCFVALVLYAAVVRYLLPPPQTPSHTHNVDWGDGNIHLLQRPPRALVGRDSPGSDISHPAPRYERHVEDDVVTYPEQVKLEQGGKHVFAFGVRGEEPPGYKGAERKERGGWSGDVCDGV